MLCVLFLGFVGASYGLSSCNDDDCHVEISHSESKYWMRMCDEGVKPYVG